MFHARFSALSIVVSMIYGTTSYELEGRSRGLIDLTTSAGGIVYAIVDGIYYVVLLRRYDGNWVLPKGHKRIDDQLLDATALREVSEEAGIAADQLAVEGLLGSYADNRFAGEHKEIFIYSIRCLDQELPALKVDVDHAEARWCTLPDALKLIANPNQRRLLDKFVDLESLKGHLS
jgi:8-oxo-dGTP pyrophosphatase MutT (NUDIX family)